jgi:hypothetical protein
MVSFSKLKYLKAFMCVSNLLLSLEAQHTIHTDRVNLFFLFISVIIHNS